jgi:hypothetical protein
MEYLGKRLASINGMKELNQEWSHILPFFMPLCTASSIAIYSDSPRVVLLALALLLATVDSFSTPKGLRALIPR